MIVSFHEAKFVHNSLNGVFEIRFSELQQLKATTSQSSLPILGPVAWVEGVLVLESCSHTAILPAL